MQALVSDFKLQETSPVVDHLQEIDHFDFIGLLGNFQGMFGFGNDVARELFQHLVLTGRLHE